MEDKKQIKKRGNYKPKKENEIKLALYYKKIKKEWQQNQH
jgi:hypothetical protein